MKQEQKRQQPKVRASRRGYGVERLSFLPAAFAGLLRLHHSTCHFTILGREYEETILGRGEPAIYTCWHFAFPAVIYHFRDRNGVLMVSRSRDGEWIARILKHLGYVTARGSPGKGGGAALRRMIAHIKAGNSVGLIADGSQGPARTAQKGVLILARHSGVPLLPVSVAAFPRWQFNSWDRTLVAKPFSRIALAFDRPIWVSRESTPGEIEKTRRSLEDSLNRLTAACEEVVEGRGPAVRSSRR